MGAKGKDKCYAVPRITLHWNILNSVTVFSKKDCAAYLARPKKTGTGGCMRSTSRIKFFKSGIPFKASSLNSWPFDITVIISLFILFLYSFSNIYNLAIHVRNAPDTPP